MAALTDFAKSVNSLVPRGFAAYARVFHPAYAGPGRTGPVSWSEIASANGRRAHAAMQLGGITGMGLAAEGHPSAQAGVFDHGPDEGMLPPEIGRPLARVLARHTVTPDVCWLAVWDGFNAPLRRAPNAPAFEVPGRGYLLLRGSVETAPEPVLAAPRSQTANIWWPDDRAWCVSTEIDLRTTYVGGSEQCVADIVGLADVEAFEIDPASGISWSSDLLNR